MTFWLVNSSQSVGEYPKLEPYIFMAEYNDQNWSDCQSTQQIRQRLKQQDDEMPPEQIDHIASVIWNFIGKIEPEDIMCVVARDASGKPTRIYFAEVTGRVEYNYELEKHIAPVSWYKETANMIRLWTSRFEIGEADAWPQAINNKKLSQSLRNFLPLPGNRFAKIAIFILITYVTMRMIRMSDRFFN